MNNIIRTAIVSILICISWVNTVSAKNSSIATILNDTSHAKRPQTPHAPYPYDTVEVEYDNADKTVHLSGTLSTPKTGGPFTTILMITGSGQQDRDETIFNHKPFAVIADYLTKQGFAVLRVDDRGKGKSTGDVYKATSMDFANDALTSIEFLKNQKKVDKHKIGVIGHSEGGFIAPILYSKHPSLAFIISLSGTGVSGADILFKQQTDPVKGLVSDESLKAFQTLTYGTLKIIHDNKALTDSEVLVKVRSQFTDWKKGVSKAIITSLNADKATPEMYGFQIMQELLPWYRYFISTEPYEYWSKVHCPVLVLNGEKDIQVYAEQNTSSIASALQSANNKNFTVKIIPGLNHLYQHCTSCTVEEYATIEETFAPEVLDIMGDWLKKTIK